MSAEALFLSQIFDEVDDYDADGVPSDAEIDVAASDDDEDCFAACACMLGVPRLRLHAESHFHYRTDKGFVMQHDKPLDVFVTAYEEHEGAWQAWSDEPLRLEAVLVECPGSDEEIRTRINSSVEELGAIPFREVVQQRKFGKKVETEVGLTILGARAKWERAEWDLVNSQRIKFVVGGFSLTSKLGSRVRVLIRPASLRDRLRFPSAVHLTHSFSVKWKAVGEHWQQPITGDMPSEAPPGPASPTLPTAKVGKRKRKEPSHSPPADPSVEYAGVRLKLRGARAPSVDDELVEHLMAFAEHGLVVD